MNLQSWAKYLEQNLDVINLNEENGEGTHWVSLYIEKNTAVSFDFFGIEYIPQEVLKKIQGKSITHNIFRIQGNDSIVCGFYCVAFIEYMFARKTVRLY